jgi:hypothetical protein
MSFFILLCVYYARAYCEDLTSLLWFMMNIGKLDIKFSFQRVDKW